MAQSHFSLSWDLHTKNMCNGLSALQQNGEFVDLTLAADGHLVKVHQVVLALASPYIKDLISSAQCPHPVIFLNKISYKTLCAILEYIYTGEVLVSVENLNELIDAGKELHIKGFDDMKKLHSTVGFVQQPTQSLDKDDKMEDGCFVETLDEDYTMDGSWSPHTKYDTKTYGGTKKESLNESVDRTLDDTIEQDKVEEIYLQAKSLTGKSNSGSKNGDQQKMSVMQYTVSNQGSLQMILNRFIYYLKYTSRKNTRQWRCVDYIASGVKCPALVVTKNDVVVQRIAAHTHPFHDKKILKKLRAGAIFSAINEAEREGNSKKNKQTSDHETETNDADTD